MTKRPLFDAGTSLIRAISSIGTIALLVAAAGCSTADPGKESTPEGTLPTTEVGAKDSDGKVAEPGESTKPVDMSKPAKPIETPLNEWAFEAFPDAFCNDGTPTGIGVYRTDSPNLVVYFQGGGACWDYLTCFTFNTATKGPFQEEQFRGESERFPESALSSSADKSPYATWNKVFVPYCTGDVHSGNNVATYKSGPNEATFHHVGRHNVEAFIHRLKATFPKTDRLAVTGSSAGGYGAFFNYPLVRDAFPSARGVLVDDAGPPLDPASVRPAIKDAFATSWGSVPAVKDLCESCVANWPLFVNTLVTRYPNDRFALLSSLEDEVIRGFMGISGAKLAEQLRLLANNHFDGTSNARYFYTTGQQHTFLGSPSTTTSLDANLAVWLTTMLDRDAIWDSVLPP